MCAFGNHNEGQAPYAESALLMPDRKVHLPRTDRQFISMTQIMLLAQIAPTPCPMRAPTYPNVTTSTTNKSNGHANRISAHHSQCQQHKQYLPLFHYSQDCLPVVPRHYTPPVPSNSPLICCTRTQSQQKRTPPWSTTHSHSTGKQAARTSHTHRAYKA